MIREEDMNRVEAGMNELYTSSEGVVVSVMEMLAQIVELTLGQFLCKLYRLLDHGVVYNNAIATILRTDDI